MVLPRWMRIDVMLLTQQTRPEAAQFRVAPALQRMLSSATTFTFPRWNLSGPTRR